MKKSIIIEGMSCNHCKMAVEKALSELDGISKVEVDLEGKKAIVYGENIVDEILKEIIEDAGYDVVKIE